MPRSVGIWFEGNQEFDKAAFMFFVLSMNKYQNSISFVFPDTLMSFTIAQARQDGGESIYEPELDMYVFITKRPLERNLFYRTQRKVALVTTATWERYFSPPSLFEYLTHAILTGTLFCITGHQLDQHKDTRGCQFEYNRIKQFARIDIALGHICGSH